MSYLSKNKALIIGAALGTFAVIMQFILMMQNRVESVAETGIRFFSFYTILTNCLVTIYFTVLWFKKPNFLLNRFEKPGFLTATTLYITVVGAVYQLVLRGIWEPTGMQKIVDELLHTFIPIYVIVFWFVYENIKKITYKSTLKWLVYPAIYLVYILFRGNISGFYPYPFVNVTELGMNKVLINSGVLLFVFITLGLSFVALGKIKANFFKKEDY